MSQSLFHFNLSLVLAHSILWEQKQNVPSGIVDDFINGDPPAQSVGESTASQLQAYIQNLPQLLKTTAGQVAPTEQTLLDAQKQLAPQQQQLATDLYGKYAPALQSLGQSLNTSDILQSGKDANALMAGPGKDLINKTDAAQRQLDPEYYKERANSAKALDDLFGSINLNGLSGSERAEVERSNAQQDAQRGIAASPSQTATVNNAMQFGSALQMKRNALADAISRATSFLPSSQGSVNAFQTGVTGTQATARSNPAMSQFGGVQPVGQTEFGTGNNLMNNINTTANNAANINANRRSGLDMFNQTFSSTMGSMPS